MVRFATTFGAFVALALLAAPGIAVENRKGSPDQGVYSAGQADEGRRIYMVKCAMCHGNDLMGTVETPALAGKFVANWGRKPLSELASYIARAMPQQDPGTLAGDDTARIVAFLLQANGFPAGAKALPPEIVALQRINFPKRRY